MAKLLPKVILDSNLINEIVNYLKIDTTHPKWDPTTLLDLECFSHPGIETHDCNILAKLPGGHICKKCNHEMGRFCTISCDIQAICWAAFAYRLGIGGKKFDDAMKNNLYVLTPQELYAKVLEKFGKEQVCSIDCECTSGEMPDTSKEEFDMADDTENTGDLLKIKDAAAYYGCSYANIFSKCKAGTLPSVEVDGKTMVKRSDLDALKGLPTPKRGRKPGSKNKTKITAEVETPDVVIA